MAATPGGASCRASTTNPSAWPIGNLQCIPCSHAVMATWAAVARKQETSGPPLHPLDSSSAAIALLAEAAKSRAATTGERRCLSCGKAFRLVERLAAHIKDKHGGVNDVGASERRGGWTLGEVATVTLVNRAPGGAQPQGRHTRRPAANVRQLLLAPRMPAVVHRSGLALSHVTAVRSAGTRCRCAPAASWHPRQAEEAAQQAEAGLPPSTGSSGSRALAGGDG